MGVIPPGTKLPPRDSDVPLWSTLGADEKRLYARMMEVFAGFLAVGFDGGTPVSAMYQGEFPFTGSIQRVVVTVGDDGPHFTPPKKDKTRD
jgi:hypothetical protein